MNHFDIWCRTLRNRDFGRFDQCWGFCSLTLGFLMAPYFPSLGRAPDTCFLDVATWLGRDQFEGWHSCPTKIINHDLIWSIIWIIKENTFPAHFQSKVDGTAPKRWPRQIIMWKPLPCTYSFSFRWGTDGSIWVQEADSDQIHGLVRGI